MKLFNISSFLGLPRTSLCGNSLCCCHPIYCQIPKFISPPSTQFSESQQTTEADSGNLESLSEIFISETYTNLMINIVYVMNKNGLFMYTPQ